MSVEEVDVNFENPIKKILKQQCPNIRIKKSALTALAMCAKSFGKTFVRASAMACDKHGTLMNSDDVISALNTLGYTTLVEPTKERAKELKKAQSEKPKPKPIDLSFDEQVALLDKLRKESIEELKRRGEL